MKDIRTSIDENRRRFLTRSAMAIGAAHLGAFEGGPTASRVPEEVHRDRRGVLSKTLAGDRCEVVTTPQLMQEVQP